MGLTGARVQRLESENLHLIHQVGELQARLSHEDACLAAAQQLAEAMEQQVQRVQAAHEAGLVQLEKEAHEHSLRSQESQEIRRRYEVLKDNYENLRQNNEKLKEKLIESENFLRTQEGKVAAAFEAQLAEARCECAQAKADRDDYEASLQECRRELERLQASVEEDEFNKENRDNRGEKDNRGDQAKQGFLSNALRRTFLSGNHK